VVVDNGRGCADEEARYSEEHIIGVLKEAEAGVRVSELARRHGDVLSLEGEIRWSDG